jgi:hypothetical protein
MAATPPVAVEETAERAPDLDPIPGRSLATGVFRQGIRSASIANDPRRARGPAAIAALRVTASGDAPPSKGAIRDRAGPGPSAGSDDACDIRAARDWPKQLLGIPRLDGWIHNRPRPFR